jgi:putative ABC transport system permease protein
MLIQLVLIGYILSHLFRSDQFAELLAVLAIMLFAASWSAVRPVADRDRHMLLDALVAIALGSIPTLALVTQWVIDAEPWFQPRYVIPLGGMIFASAMNSVSLAAERLHAETGQGRPVLDARRTAFHASMIPMVNSFFAVGLVSLPGMMTGQVLSGVSPLIAAQYQIVVMTMLFGASGMASAIYLVRRGRRRAG